MECFMPHFALIIVFYHVKIACYQLSHQNINCKSLIDEKVRLKHTSTKRLKEKLFNRLDRLRLSKNTSFKKEREFIDENQGKPFDCLLICNGGPGLCHICDVTIECLW